MITLARSLFIRIFEWADNVVFFRKNHISYVYIASLNLVVYGMSYDRQEITEAMYDQLRPMRRLKDGGLFRKAAGISFWPMAVTAVIFRSIRINSDRQGLIMWRWAISTNHG